MKKKTLTIAIALVLVVALAVGATYAYLTAKTGEVKNTFVVGSILDDGAKLNLYEHVADKQSDGSYKLGSDTINANGNTYTIMPGVNLPKDPTVEVTDNEKGTSEYYLFVKVTEGAGFTQGILGYTVASEWKQLTDADGHDVAGVYVYVGSDASAKLLKGNFTATKILAPTADTTDSADNTITVADKTANEFKLNDGDCTLTFQAYACQAAGMTPYAAYQAASK